MTKSQINTLGKSLRQKMRNGEELDQALLQSLQNYRTSYKEDIAPVFNIVSTLSKEERSDSIVSFRIKRIESILSKIKREPTMALGNMGDIAGCRIILYSQQALINLVNSINIKFKVKNYNDYTVKPKADGYKGYHLYVYSPINEHKIIEIQLRTISTHRWASLVEILDILYDLKLKEGEQHPDLQHFLLLLSRHTIDLSIEEKKKIIDIDKKYKIYQVLNEVFIKNHISIRKDYLKLSENLNNCYFIIEVDSNKKSNIYSIRDYENAESRYFKMFLFNKSSNFVLTHIEKPTFKKLCVAYASYMMIKHDYLNDWNEFAHEIIQDGSKNRKVSKNLYQYIDYFQQNLEDELSLLDSELLELESHIKNIELGKSYGVSEWLKEYKERHKKLKVFINFLYDFKQNNIPFWKKFFRIGNSY